MEHLEGRLSVLAALHARKRRFKVVLIREGMRADAAQDVVDAAESARVPVRRAPRSELDALSHGATHGGIIAICSEKPRTFAGELLELIDHLREPPLLLMLEGVDDARNLGFTIRSAEALGAHALLVKKHLWDFDAVEVARPASGAYERMPLVQIDSLTPLAALQRRGVRLLGAVANAKRSLHEVDMTGPTLLVVGGEKRGISGAVRGICDQFLSIPTRRGASSLALSHAAAILLAEAMRQRSGRR